MSNRFAVFPQYLEPCYTIFEVSQLNVYIQTEVKLQISASCSILTNDTGDETDAELGQCKLQDYSRIVTCSQQYLKIHVEDSSSFLYGYKCNINCPSECMCSPGAAPGYFARGGETVAAKNKNLNGLSIGCEAATARVKRAGGGFGRGCPPPIRFFWILVCLKSYFPLVF